MSRHLIASILCLSVLGVLPPVIPAQSAGQHSGRSSVVGEVTSIDITSRTAVITADAGQSVMLSFNDNTRFLKVPAGSTSLSSASETTLAAISVGDRVSSRGLPTPDRKALLADTVVVMSKADIQKKQEQDTREWAARSIAGVVRELRPDTAEITLDAYGPSGLTRIIVQTAGCKFHRYSPSSVKFSDARPGTFSDLKVGDQLRALGIKSSTGAIWNATEIVSGSFQTIGGLVTAIDSANSEIKITVLGQKREAVVVVTHDSVLKRITPQAAMIIAQRALGLRQAPAAAGQKAAAASAQKGSVQPPQLPDSQQIIESLPKIEISGIKPGDVIAVTSAAGDPSRVTAIKLVAGVDVVVNAINARAGQRQVVALSAGLPLGVFDYGIGQQ